MKYDDVQEEYVPVHDELKGYLHSLKYELTKLEVKARFSGYVYLYNGYHGLTVEGTLYTFDDPGYFEALEIPDKTICKDMLSS